MTKIVDEKTMLIDDSGLENTILMCLDGMKFGHLYHRDKALEIIHSWKLYFMKAYISRYNMSNIWVYYKSTYSDPFFFLR